MTSALSVLFAFSIVLYGHIFYNPPGRGVIGVLINTKTGIISKVFRDSPAWKGGVQVNDKVYLVDNKPNNCKNIEGEPGTEVEVWIDRSGTPLYYTFTRIDSRELLGYPNKW